MNRAFGWLLAAAASFVAWRLYSWPGLALALSALVFLLLLQFNRAVRVTRMAAESPLGIVPNAVMFHAGLRPGLTMQKVVTMARSLGRKVEGSDDDWLWRDGSGSTVRLHFERARLVRWQIERSGDLESAPRQQ